MACRQRVMPKMVIYYASEPLTSTLLSRMVGDGVLHRHCSSIVPFEGAMPRFRALSLGATMHRVKRSALDQVSTAVLAVSLLARSADGVAPIHKQLITLTGNAQNLRRIRGPLLPGLRSDQIDVEATT